MSQENVEIVRRAYAAWNAGDMEALRELYDPDVIMRAIEGWPEPGPYELLDFEQEANQVLAVVRMSMRDRTSELKLEQTIAHMFTLGENDKVIRVEGFFDPDKARAALKSEVG
jgi:ketosteroid isomerase-like protein